ncbi:MAG: hypothetical protein LBB46_00645, partial [Coriobacteriaceae bacterium]|nr:hypothetical protein [Coriobacteriaceae bacterium]
MNTMKNNRRRGKTAGTSRKALAILLAATLAITMVGPGVSFAEEAIVAPDGSDVVYGNPAPEQPADSPAAPEPPAGSAGNAGSAAPAGEEGLGFDAFDAVVDPAADPDEGPGAIGIMPLAVTPIGPGQVSIDNWADLRQAMGDPNVNYIRFNGDIRRTGGTAAANDLPGITRTLTIDGNGHELDFRNDGASTNINTRGIQLNTAPSTGATLTVQNLTVIKPNVATGSQGSAHFIVGTATNSDRWTVNFNNLTAPKEGPTRPFCGLISAPRATLNVTGVLDWYSGAANAIIMETQQQYYSGANTVVNIVGHEGLNNSTVFIRQNQSTRLNIFSVRGGAQVYFDSRNIGNTNTIDMEINETATTRAEFIVDGVGTILDVKGLGRGTGTSGGTITMQAGARTAVFQVTGGAKCFVRSLAQNTGQPALVIQCDGTRFLADGKGTELLFESFGQSNNLGATLRFRLRGNQEFRASNLADITVIRHANTGSNRAAAIRFGTGTGNSFYAESGATIHVYNEGSAAYATSASGDNNNSGIEYRANNWTFDVTGYETAIEVYSNRGPAIGAGSVNNGNISVGDGSVFIAHGWSGAGTSASTHGAIDTGTVTFASTSPLSYDFTSLNPAANARVFNVNGAASRFSQTNSDIAAWGNGRSRVADAAGNATNSSNNPIEGNPYKSWTMVRGFTMGGNNFAVANQFSTQDPGYFTNAVDNFGSQGTWPYRRISGNNAAPKIGDVLPATNADKYVRATGRVPEGLDFDGRYVWDDEVYSRWNITRGSTTTTSVAGQATSLRYEDIYTVETGVDTLEGIVRYSNGEFLHPGDRYQIMQAWRGEVDDPNSQRVHHARPGDITTKVVTVEDILPPVPATVSTPSNGKIWIGLTTAISGTWTPNQAAAQPHNPEPAVKLYAVIDSMDKVVMDGSTPVAGTLDANGTWTYNLPVAVSNSLTDGQRVFFILEDANGNKTPLAPTPCHDTMIDPSPYLTASQPDLILNHDDQYIGLNMAKDIARLGTNTTSQLDRLKSLINARAERRAPEVTLGLDVRVTQVAPPWDTESYYNIDLFAPLWPMGKPYDLRYEAVAAPEIYNTGMVTVLPFDEAAPFIGANDFTISTNNATDLMSLPLAQRNAELIKLAGARARVSLTDPFTADLVLVHDVDIPNPAQVGSYDVTFYVNGFT